MAERSAISQLAVMSKDRTKDIGYLRKRKEQLEFRIATEAFTLEVEKDLIRKKAAIEKELNEALASYRLRKKSEYLDKDIETLGKRSLELEAKIKESDKKLDVLYSNLRRLTGESRRNNGKFEKREKKEPKNMEVSLADIAVIKDKKDNGSAVDDAVLN